MNVRGSANVPGGDPISASGGGVAYPRGVTHNTVELSNLYDHAWANGTDKYIVTDDPNFNPNGQVNGNWGQLQLVRPQP